MLITGSCGCSGPPGCVQGYDGSIISGSFQFSLLVPEKLLLLPQALQIYLRKFPKSGPTKIDKDRNKNSGNDANSIGRGSIVYG